jgi:hypothetical protein
MKLSMSICLSDKDPITAYTQQLNLFRNSPREDVVVYRLLKFFTLKLKRKENFLSYQTQH